MRRKGFTIIELLVSMSLVILIMAVLASAFSVGLGVFRKLKAMGDMADNMRAVATQLRSDLSRDHFEGSIRLSDPCFSSPVLGSPIRAKPREGFFAIRQFGPSIVEGAADGIISYRSPTSPIPPGSTVLHMTVKLRGNRQENFFGASCPPASPLLAQPTTFFNQPGDARHQKVDPIDGSGVYTSQWAEVAWFLQQLPADSAGNYPSANGTPLFALYRLVRVLIADNSTVNSLVPNVNWNQYGGFSITGLPPPPPAIPPPGINLYFNTPVDMTDPAKRAMAGLFVNDPADPTIPGNFITRTGTQLITNVISFNVQVIPAVQLPPTLPPAAPAPAEPLPPFGFPVSTSDFVDISNALDPATGVPLFLPGLFESSNTLAGLQAIKITLRVWDLRTQQARQITIIQDM